MIIETEFMKKKVLCVGSTVGFSNNLFTFSLLFIEDIYHKNYTECEGVKILFNVNVGGPWLSGRVLASGPVGPGIDTPPGHGWCGRQAS